MSAASPPLGPFYLPTAHEAGIFALSGIWIFVAEVLLIEALRSRPGLRNPILAVASAFPTLTLILHGVTVASVGERLADDALREAPVMLAIPHPAWATVALHALFAGLIPLLLCTVAQTAGVTDRRSLLVGILGGAGYAALHVVLNARTCAPDFTVAALFLLCPHPTKLEFRF